VSEISIEEEFIIKKVEENSGKFNYKELQTLCKEEFEGVRLIKKK